MPYNIIINATYRIKVSSQVCLDVFSNEVLVECAPPPNECACLPVSLAYNNTQCSLSWAQPNCAGYTTTLVKFTGFDWITVSSTSPYQVPANHNGTYALLMSKSGCLDVFSNDIEVTCSCASPASITLLEAWDGSLGSNRTIIKNQSITHEMSACATMCDDNNLSLYFDPTIVNEYWQFVPENSDGLAVTFSGILNTYPGQLWRVGIGMLPYAGDTETLYIISPCGDMYTLILENDCVDVDPCTVTNLVLNAAGDTNQSCANLQLTTSGGVAPYTYTINGTGSMGTVINQSSSNIDLSGMNAGEYMLLNVIATDQNGCSIASSFDYIRCSNGCSNSTCLAPNFDCGSFLLVGHTFNSNALIPFIVPSGVSSISIGFDPLPAHQTFKVYKNGILVIDAGTIVRSPYNSPCNSTNHINLANYPNQAPLTNMILGTGYKQNSSPIGNCGIFPIAVSQGDLIEIDINHPSCNTASSWSISLTCPNSNNPSDINHNVNEVMNKELLSYTDGNFETTFEIAPNPTTSGIFIKMGDQIDNSYTVNVSNNVGKNLISKENLKTEDLYLTEFENLPAGIYYVSVITGGHVKTQKVIKL